MNYIKNIALSTLVATAVTFIAPTIISNVILLRKNYLQNLNKNIIIRNNKCNKSPATIDKGSINKRSTIIRDNYQSKFSTKFLTKLKLRLPNKYCCVANTVPKLEDLCINVILNHYSNLKDNLKEFFKRIFINN